jgi:hypothetical protein
MQYNVVATRGSSDPGLSFSSLAAALDLHLTRRDHIHLLILLDKDEQEDLDSQERTALRRMVAELKRI